MTDLGLKPKMEAFCRAYIETGNASEAYRRSYDASRMAPSTINRKAADLLRNGKITARLEELRAGHQKRHEATIDRVVAELCTIAFADAGDFFDWGPDGVKVKAKADLTPEQRAVVAEVAQTITEAGGTIRVKLHNKLDALDKIARHLGMYKELRLHEHTGKDGAPLFGEPIDKVDLARRLFHLLKEAQDELAARASNPATPEDPVGERPTKH